MIGRWSGRGIWSVPYQRTPESVSMPPTAGCGWIPVVRVAVIEMVPRNCLKVTADRIKKPQRLPAP